MASIISAVGVGVSTQQTGERSAIGTTYKQCAPT